MNWLKNNPSSPSESTSIERHALLQPLAAISSIPHFTLENASANTTLLADFYDVLIKLTKEGCVYRFVRQRPTVKSVTWQLVTWQLVTKKDIILTNRTR